MEDLALRAAEAPAPDEAGTPAARPRARGAHKAPKGVRPERASRGRRSRRSGRHRRILPDRPFWQELPILIVIALVVAYVVKTFLLQVFYIPSGSMENTLRIGDRVLVDKVTYDVRDIRRGDVIVFNADGVLAPEGGIAPAPPSNPVQGAAQGLASAIGLAPSSETDFIKRVIGVGGDRVQCCDAQGRMTVNGVPLDESAYLFPGDVPSQTPFDVIVPEGKLWVMGDHRSNSADSRSRIGSPGGGFVPVDRVVGRAFVVTWPFGSIGGLGIPDTFTQPLIQQQQPQAASLPPLTAATPTPTAAATSPPATAPAPAGGGG